jgi:integrase
LIRITVREFLSNVAVADRPGRIVLDAPRVRQWVIRDVAGRSVRYAAERLAILRRFLAVLARAELADADLMAEFRMGHGHWRWHRLVRVLQGENCESVLAHLRATAPSPGPLTPFVRTYLELHRSMGKDYRGPEIALYDLDRSLRVRSTPSPQAVTPALVESWMNALTCCPRSRVHQIRAVGRFFDYLRSLSVVTHNPVPRLLSHPHRWPRSTFKPFIFTPEQLAAILGEARRLSDNHRCPCRAATLSTMLTLLIALGLRHGEVRRLRIRDLDLERRVLSIVQTKFHKNRYVPYGPKIDACLQRYLVVRRTLMLPVRDDDPLFVTKWRKPLCLATLLIAFRDILRTLGIEGIPGQGPPRLHDVRHTFAVHRLLRWYREGVDVQSRLPALSTFLGHVSLQSTEVYLTVTTDLLREANARFHRQFGVQFDEKEAP